MKKKKKKFYKTRKFKKFIIILLGIVIVFLVIYEISEKYLIISKNDTVNSNEKVDNETKQVDGKNDYVKVKYDDDWYTSGVLDPQKIPSKVALNLNQNLILINKQYKVSKDYVPQVEEVDGYYLTPEAKAAYLEMKAAAQEEQVYLKIGSAYRSYQYQEQVFNGYLQNDSYAKVLSYSAYPGTSEHQSGLAIDFVENGSCDYTDCFSTTKSGQWLAENAYKYGFVLRFPKDKVDITGYEFEPWHYRYVGKEDAKKIYDDNVTLEEYVLTKNE